MHYDAQARVRAKILNAEGPASIERTSPPSSPVREKGEVDLKREQRYNAGRTERRPSFGAERPSRVVVSGWNVLDNNWVNFLMALIMTVSGMGVAGWWWNVPVVMG